MFLVIGIWGSRQRKVRAAYFFLICTLFGSLFMLLALAYIHLIAGTINFKVL
ncbi:unnamed protein product [Discosporangium mesarthrocarpum]